MQAADFILDAGHGGEDGGAVSPGGIKESELNLDMTLRLDCILGFLGRSSVLPRKDDRSIHDDTAVTLREKKVSDLKNRVALIAQYPEATVVSIHQNSFSDPKYKGTQVFYAGTGGSEPLAKSIQEAIVTNLQPDNNRIQKKIPDSVYLMNHIKNRAVLIECGFLTNPDDEHLLPQETYQTSFALTVGIALLNESL